MSFPLERHAVSIFLRILCLHLPEQFPAGGIDLPELLIFCFVPLCQFFLGLHPGGNPDKPITGRFHIRINVDAESYREKREDSLRRYARKKAQQVLKARRRTTLEPMNAYERHVIHAALQDMENISTHSTGTEPNRRVVIEYVR